MFRIITEGERFSEYAFLRDGERVLLRAATPDDVPAVEALFARVSRESLQMRFMGAVAQVSPSVLQILCTSEPRDRMALLALVGQEPGRRVVGLGNYISLSAARAEVAFLVDDEFQGRGISTLLLERLAGIAAASGFVGFEAEMLYENQPMINVFRDSGFEVHQAVHGGSIHVAFPVSGLAALRERAELRDRIATANSLVPLLRPRSVAVIGASRDPDSMGHMIFRAILQGNFAGTASPVNGQAASVRGVRAYASIRDLPEPAEMAVIAVPAPAVLEAAEEALDAGTRGLLVVTSGFAESGPEGAARQQRLLDLVRAHGARIIGPNCLGLMNTHPEVSLNASLGPTMPPRGRIGFFSHSAALGLVILSTASERGLGFSTFVSAGNRADVSGNDLLEYWEEDPSTDIALLYLETFGDPRRFARIARRFSRRKPILCVKSARSQAGQDVARAHIGAVAQGEPQVDVLFRQAGVVRAETLEELFDVAVLLASQPLPRGNRVAIVSNSGGVLTISADACAGHGLAIGRPGITDLGALATLQEYEAAVQRTMEDDDVDAVIVIFACLGNCDPNLVGRAIRSGVLKAERRTGVPKPALLCLMGAAGALEFGGAPSSRHVFPSYRFPESAALALSRAVHYAAFRSRPQGRPVYFEDVDAAAARQRLMALLPASGEEPVWVEGQPAWDILGCFGIPLAPAGGPSALALQVRSERSFGPLVQVERPGAAPVVRITPLTDEDAREIVEAAGLAPGSGLEGLLGRVSQLIEELPWLFAMDARVGPGTVAPEGAAALGRDVRIGFQRGPAPGGPTPPARTA
jgi:acyl-CoA synthetase (NDP forming)/GNAT superfamily N-acetyltransferase